MINAPVPPARDKLLFTPGPLTTSLTVKHAMLHDAGPWHFEFNSLVRDLRLRLLQVAGVDPRTFECVLMQGSGTFGVEAVFATALPPAGKLLVVSNGAYGERMIQMAQCLKIPVATLRFPEDKTPDPAQVSELLARDRSITHVAMVHCETTTGLLNPIEPIGKVVARNERVFIVDAMSSFAAVPIDFADCGIDYLVSSPNKCIESVPGFSFVIARKTHLLACEGHARSLSLDLLAQLKGFEKNGQFRFTPPTHAILALAEALDELDLEGGILGRAARYNRNHQALLAGMRKLGFKPYLPTETQSYIITAFHYPADPRFSFPEFYRRLSDAGFIIYPGKLSHADLFRIGNIGRLFEADMIALVAAIAAILEQMGIEMERSA
jgi:2-aminoethylphosphonate-pyruvate transaminase